MSATDEERFTDFVRAHSGTLFRTAYLMTGDYQRSEDLLQATLVRVYQHWSRVDVMERPVAYARKVLVNQANSWWRRRSSHELPSDSSRRRTSTSAQFAPVRVTAPAVRRPRWWPWWW